MSLGQYETGLRSTYQAARQRLFHAPAPMIPEPPKPEPVAPPTPRPREPYVCTNLEAQFPVRWIRGIVIEICERRDVPPLLVASSCQIKRCVAARIEIWATLHDMRVPTERLAVMFNKDHTTVAYGIRRYKGEQPKKHKPRGTKK